MAAEAHFELRVASSHADWVCSHLDGTASVAAAATGAAATAAAAARIVVVRSTDEFRQLARLLPAELGKPAFAVDIGSAFGHTTELLADELGESAVLGVDTGWRFVSASRKRCPSLRFERLDVLEDAPFLAQLVARTRASLPPAAPGPAAEQLWVWADISGIREIGALVRLLPLCTERLGAAVVVVKSERLSALAHAHLVAADAGGASFWERACREAAAGGQGGADAASQTARYPLKLPVRYTTIQPCAGGPPATVEICRFHNYAAAGCIRRQQNRCPLDHDACHWCGAKGHVARECEAWHGGDEPICA